MNIKPIRIVHMIGSLEFGGSQSMIINIYKKIDRTSFQFDFILHHSDKKDLQLLSTVKDLGAKVYFLPKFKGWNLLEIIKSWHSFYKHHPEYKIIHSHVRSYASIFLSIAKKHGLKTIIHSHSTNNGNGLEAFVKKILQYPLRFIADYFFSCSDEAGKWLFGKNIINNPNYKVIPNAIDVEKYKFSQIIRKKYRKKLNVNEDKKVFIHVGRFHQSKNHKFLIDLFAEIHNHDPNSILVLVGDGELRPQIEKQIEELGLRDSVKLLGVQSDVNCWLQGADCMLFPSLWEGLPLTIVEAQASGLPVIVSDNITSETFLTNLITPISLNKDLKYWAENCLNFEKNFREDGYKVIAESKYNIKKSVKLLTQLYKEIIQRE